MKQEYRTAKKLACC